MICPTLHRLALAALAGCVLVTPALAEPAENLPGISIELSAADTRDGACLVSFLVQNRHPEAIGKAVFETVLFGPDGQVAQMTLLDFQDLPAGRPRVRQFEFPGLACPEITRMLINGATTCDGPAESACIDGLHLSTRTGTELIG